MARTIGSYATRVQAPALQQAWQSMRVMRRFTTADILTTAQIGDSAITKYVKALNATGFLRLVKPIVSGKPGSRNVYMLVRDSGPQAPIRRADGSGVYDRNTGTVYRMPEPEKAAEAPAKGEAHE